MTRSSGETIDLEDARVGTDGLVGTGSDGRRVAVALSDVQQIETRQVHVDKTALLVGGVALGALLAVGYAATENIEDLSEGATQ